MPLLSPSCANCTVTVIAAMEVGIQFNNRIINHSMAWVGRTCEDQLVQHPCPGKGHLPLGQVTQSPVQPDIKHLQCWGIHNFSGRPVLIIKIITQQHEKFKEFLRTSSHGFDQPLSSDSLEQQIQSFLSGWLCKEQDTTCSRD